MLKIIFGMIFLMSSNASVACYRNKLTVGQLNHHSVERVMSQNGKFLLEMYPAKWSGKNENFIKLRESLGVVYSVAQDGLMEKLWSMKGLYSVRYEPENDSRSGDNLTHYLSNDGSKVVSVLNGDNWSTNNSLLVVYDESGVINEITSDQLGGLVVYRCLTSRIATHRVTSENNIELKTFGSSSWPVKKWLLSMDSGELKRAH